MYSLTANSFSVSFLKLCCCFFLFKNVSSKKCLVKKNLGQKMFDKRKFGSNIACNIAFNFRFNIWFTIGPNIGFNIGVQYSVRYCV